MHSSAVSGSVPSQMSSCGHHRFPRKAGPGPPPSSLPTWRGFRGGDTPAHATDPQSKARGSLPPRPRPPRGGLPQTGPQGRVSAPPVGQSHWAQRDPVIVAVRRAPGHGPAGRQGRGRDNGRGSHGRDFLSRVRSERSRGPVSHEGQDLACPQAAVAPGTPGASTPSHGWRSAATRSGLGTSLPTVPPCVGCRPRVASHSSDVRTPPAEGRREAKDLKHPPQAQLARRHRRHRRPSAPCATALGRPGSPVTPARCTHYCHPRACPSGACEVLEPEMEQRVALGPQQGTEDAGALVVGHRYPPGRAGEGSNIPA